MTIMIPAWVNGTLQPVEKLEAHERGLKHKAVSVFVTRGDDVLIQRRALGKYHTPGLWANTCCTHPNWDEVVEIFRAEAAPGMTLAPNPEEVMDIRWIPRTVLEVEVRETPELFTPWLRIYLDRHAGLVFGPDTGAAD